MLLEPDVHVRFCNIVSPFHDDIGRETNDPFVSTKHAICVDEV